MGWTSPKVLTGLIGGVALLVAFGVIETRVADPMIDLRLFQHPRVRRRARRSTCSTAMSRGGLQFMLIIWLQGIWLPLHGYNFADTPLWAGIYMLPLTIGFLIAGPASGAVSDRFGARAFATGGLLLTAATFVGLILLPAELQLLAVRGAARLNGIGIGLGGRAEHGRDHERRAGLAARRGVRHPGHRHERRHGAVDGRVLHADGGRAGQPAAARADARPHRGRRLRRSGRRRVAVSPVGTLFAAFLGDNPIRQLVPNPGAGARHRGIYGRSSSRG